jgi:hypothetical protein
MCAFYDFCTIGSPRRRCTAPSGRLRTTVRQVAARRECGPAILEISAAMNARTPGTDELLLLQLRCSACVRTDHLQSVRHHGDM